MKRWGLALTICAAAAALHAAPASADGTVLFTDACGDAQSVVAMPEFTFNVGTARTARHDIKQTTFAPLVEGGAVTGVRVSLEVCGPIPAPEQLSSYWAAGATLPDGCVVDVSLVDQLTTSGTSTRTGGFTKFCSRPDDLPDPVPPGYTSDERFDLTLPAGAVSVSGATITWTLRHDALAGEALEAVAVDTAWSGLRSATRDQARGTEFMNDDGTARREVNGPGAADESRGTAAFVIG